MTLTLPSVRYMYLLTKPHRSPAEDLSKHFDVSRRHVPFNRLRVPIKHNLHVREDTKMCGESELTEHQDQVAAG